MALKLAPIAFIRRNSITKWRINLIYTLPLSFSSCLSMFSEGCITIRLKSAFAAGCQPATPGRSRSRSNLLTPALTPTTVKTVDSDRLQLRSRLRLRSPGRAPQPYQMEISQYNNMYRVLDTSRYHPELPMSIFKVKVIHGHEVKNRSC